jgi:DNA-binding NtrC family response regulator
MPDQWRRALLRAALREVGYDAVGARNLEDARRYRAIEPGRGTVQMVIVHVDALESAGAELSEMLASHHTPPVVLLAHATHEAPPGAWSRVMQMPFSVADVVEAVQSAVPLPASKKYPLD